MNLQIFTSPEFGQVRTLQLEGETWFVAKAVPLNRSNRTLNKYAAATGCCAYLIVCCVSMVLTWMRKNKKE